MVRIELTDLMLGTGDKAKVKGWILLRLSMLSKFATYKHHLSHYKHSPGISHNSISLITLRNFLF